MRAHPGGVVAVVIGLLAACSGGSQPCASADCPSVAGTWSFTWRDGVPSGSCPARGPRPETLVLTQKASTAATTIAAVPVEGVLYDSWDLSLKGAGGGTEYALHGRVMMGARDAGLHMDGTLTTTTTPDAGAPCPLSESFSADQR